MSQPLIVVADDSRTVRTLVRQILQQAGFAVCLAEDGREAVDAVVAKRPDLVVLDIHMPGMDGYEACEQLLALGPPFDEIPIILLTHDEGPHLQTLGSELGAYLRKPVQPEKLIPIVRTLLDREGGRRTRPDVALT